jgi:hypothetical protein
LIKFKIILQLNGTIVTLLHIDQENCGTMIRTTTVLITELWQDLYVFERYWRAKSSPVSMMRIKYLTENEDYVIKKEFQSIKMRYTNPKIISSII